VPVAGEPVRLVRCRHAACGTATRVRLPRELPARVVRRVVCDGCHVPFECDAVLEVGVLGGEATNGAAPTGNGAVPAGAKVAERATPWRARMPRWLSNPNSRAWRYLSIPVAAAVVVGALMLIQGSGDSSHHARSASGAAKRATPGSGAAGSAHGASVVKGSNYTVAMPSGWHRTEPKHGATFAAETSGGDADATLWIRRDPSLGFPEFQSRSLAQLHALAGSAHVLERTAGPTPESSVVTLAADSPPGQPAYEVTLRLAGPYRYYLATTVDPNASRAAVDGADLIHNSFVPQARGGSG
jgi:hypothetical protein